MLGTFEDGGGIMPKISDITREEFLNMFNEFMESRIVFACDREEIHTHIEAFVNEFEFEGD
jgi:hypothetical protein